MFQYKLNHITLILSLFAILAMNSVASDHIDSKDVAGHPLSDLSDLYAFPSPDDPGKTTFVLNVFPAVAKSGHFESKVSYRLYINPVQLQPSRKIYPGVTINCKFASPHWTSRSNYQMICDESRTHTRQTTKWQEIQPSETTKPHRIYFGMHSDPFFFNLDFFNRVVNKDQLVSPRKKNDMEHLNVLSMVINVDLKKLFPNTKTTLFGVAAAAIDLTTPQPQQLDWVGRPEVTNLSLIRPNASDIRSEYNNGQSRIGLSLSETSAFRARLKENIQRFDQLNGKTEWEPADLNRWALLAADDHLLFDIDPSKICNQDSFLKIEWAYIKGEEQNNCGGRRLTDDVMDWLYTTYIASPRSRGLYRDGVSKPDVPVSDQFPYLAKPDKGFGFYGSAKAWGFRNLSWLLL